MGEEDLDQINVVNWFRFQYKDVLIYHCPNGGRRNVREAVKLQRMGVVAGIPDLYVPKWHLWIEMKKKKGGTLSKEQKEIIAYLQSIGDTVLVCRGFEEAKEMIMEFVNNA